MSRCACRNHALPPDPEPGTDGPAAPAGANRPHTPLEVIGRLVAEQSQEPNWAYVGVWCRIHTFTQSRLTPRLRDRQAVRSGLLRSTQHLAAADDFRRQRRLLQPILVRGQETPRKSHREW
ncbi:DNA glycosylase AlkZ-like family protein [Streptomyces aureus]|uniref:DNA glycosylase AlkZ-like family protein n=1 Tax=Streptomyces aureus TaxID=193461 RepID=A0ABV4SAX7_9ACTN